MKLLHPFLRLCFTAFLFQILLMQHLSAQPSKTNDTWLIKLISIRSFGSIKTFDAPIDYSITKSKISYERRGKLNIVRFDLKKRWIIDKDKKTYTERVLGYQDTSKKVIPITKAGLEYEPDYYWEIKDLGRDSVINGWKCHLFVAFGDADYSDRTVYFWSTHDLPSNLEILNEKSFRDILPGTDVSDKLFEHIKPLNAGVVIYLKDFERPSIVRDPIILEYKVDKVEPLNKMDISFELPEGLKKLN
ncbi:MAG: hypothetical protein Q8933_17685 [Bacteroidota bacterium]|nr:hypothetical protein [Bacteroidota bacterium]MDP4196832.1 hypothetical protein [Bacteroidota bacterium]